MSQSPQKRKLVPVGDHESVAKGVVRTGGLLTPQNSWTERELGDDGNKYEQSSPKRARLADEEVKEEEQEEKEEEDTASLLEKYRKYHEKLARKMKAVQTEIRRLEGETVAQAIDASNPSRYFLFLDLETNTCFGEMKDITVLEIGYRMTDPHFVPLDEGERSVINLPIESHRAGMPPVVIEMHVKSRLLEDLRSLKPRYTLKEAEQRVLGYLAKHKVPDDRFSKITMAGCGCSFDYRVLAEHMPNLAKRLHYQVFDPTTIWHLTERKYGIKRPKNTDIVAHRALEDVNYSIELSKRFAKYAFKDQALFEWPAEEGWAVTVAPQSTNQKPMYHPTPLKKSRTM